MASQIIGRTDCPECGFVAAHVKRSEKCLYRYCPECGSQHMAKSPRQAADLMAKTRTLDATATAATDSAPAPPAAPPAALPPAAAAMPPPLPAAAAPRRRGLFG